VAVNSLWPVTIIESQASINHQLGTKEMWRKPDILVDCVLRLATREPSAMTGQALLDEDFLRAEGVTDFSGYACVPGSQPPRLSWPAPGKGWPLLTEKGSFEGAAGSTTPASPPRRRAVRNSCAPLPAAREADPTHRLNRIDLLLDCGQSRGTGRRFTILAVEVVAVLQRANESPSSRTTT
jgi:hypothetical protein